MMFRSQSTAERIPDKSFRTDLTRHATRSTQARIGEYMHQLNADNQAQEQY